MDNLNELEKRDRTVLRSNSLPEEMFSKINVIDDHIIVSDGCFNERWGYAYDDKLNFFECDDPTLRSFIENMIYNYCLENFLIINGDLEAVSKRIGSKVDFIYFKDYGYHFYFEGLKNELKKRNCNKDNYEFNTIDGGDVMYYKKLVPVHRSVPMFDFIAVAYKHEMETDKKVLYIEYSKKFKYKVR